MKLTWRIWLLIIVLICSAIMISPSFQKGVIIKSVEKNSTAYEEGLRSGMIIKSINGDTVNSMDDYTRIISLAFPAKEINPASTIKPLISNTENNASKNISSGISNNSDNSSDNKLSADFLKNNKKLTITTKDSEFI